MTLSSFKIFGETRHFGEATVNQIVTNSVSKRGVVKMKIPANQLIAGIRVVLGCTKTVFVARTAFFLFSLVFFCISFV